MQFIFIVCQVEGYQDAAADHLLLPRIELLTKKKTKRSGTSLPASIFCMIL